MDDENAAYLWNRRQALKLRTLCNRLYQQERWRVFELREGLAKGASLVAGSVALSRVVNPNTVNACLAVIFVMTSASLVFNWGNKGRDAARRSSDWTSLERDIEAAGERSFSEEQLNLWTARAGEIEANEPAMNPGMHERAYLRACEAMGTEPCRPSTWWERNRPALIVH